MVTVLGPLVHALGQIDGMKLLLERLPPNSELREDDKTAVAIFFSVWQMVAHDLGLPLCFRTASFVVGPYDENCKNPPTTIRWAMIAKEALRRVLELDESYRDDTGTRFVFVLTSERSPYFHRDFGTDVAQRFPEAQKEIKEAHGCYALGRDTASVFHLMRAVEHALRALIIGVGGMVRQVPLNYEDWNYLVEQVDSCWKVPIEAWGHSVERTHARTFFKRVVADLNAFKDERNIVMHTRRSYDGPSALGVFNRVGDWFGLLAPKASEDISPNELLQRALFL